MQGQFGDVGVIGATSIVGTCLLPLLADAGCKVAAFYHPKGGHHGRKLLWVETCSALPDDGVVIPFWICLAPIWVLPSYFSRLASFNVRRVIALSSTSCISKRDSTDSDDRHTALRIAEAEQLVQSWAQAFGVEWIILRSTLIYGLGKDKNINVIAGFIRRFGFFPMLGPGTGLRQPIHARDVAHVCLSALNVAGVANRIYVVSGGETLPYCAMVARVFLSLGRKPRILILPQRVFRWTVALVRLLPRYRLWSMAMVERMNIDLVFDHHDAARDLNFAPGRFSPNEDDFRYKS